MIAQKNLNFEKRKQQAIELGVDVSKKDLTIEYLEEQIAIKLEKGMKDLKNIIEEINF